VLLPFHLKIASAQEKNLACRMTDMSFIRPYLYSLLPENTVKSERCIVDTL
jgi:hypothetical protein